MIRDDRRGELCKANEYSRIKKLLQREAQFTTKPNLKLDVKRDNLSGEHR